MGLKRQSHSDQQDWQVTPSSDLADYWLRADGFVSCWSYRCRNVPITPIAVSALRRLGSIRGAGQMARGFNERHSDLSVPARSETEIDVFLGHTSKMAPIGFKE